MNREILDKLIFLKAKYIYSGCIIKGVFGSYARNEELPTSDIDILFEVSPTFKLKHKGFEAIAELDKIKREIEEYLALEVDFIQVNTLCKTSSKFIMENFINV